jgi:cytochrome P450
VEGLWELRKMGEGKGGKEVDLIPIMRAYAMDTIAGYLFKKPYGALKEVGLEKEGEFTPAGFVDAFVAQGAFFHLPQWVDSIYHFFQLPSKETEKAFERVETYTAGVVETAVVSIKEGGGSGQGSYAGRLLEKGVGERQARIECKDLIFAGADSTGASLAMICWFLVKHPEM